MATPEPPGLLVVACAVALAGDAVLLVRHTEHGGNLTGSWGLPAGRAEPGEDVVATALRELEEETGLVVRREDAVPLEVGHLVMIRRKAGVRPVSLHAVLVRRWAGRLRPSRETEPAWVPIAGLPRVVGLLPATVEIVDDALRAAGTPGPGPGAARG